MGCRFVSVASVWVTRLAPKEIYMTNDELRQFAMLQLETLLAKEGESNEADRLWAALYCVQAMNDGHRPEDFDAVIHHAHCLDEGCDA